MLQELIGIINEIEHVKIWFGRLQASRLSITRFLAIIAIKKREKVSVGCKERPKYPNAQFTITGNGTPISSNGTHYRYCPFLDPT